MSHLTFSAASCFSALYVVEIRDLQQEIAALRCWTPSDARDALIEAREERIEELEGCLEFGASVEARSAEVIEITSPADQLAEVAVALRIAEPSLVWSVEASVPLQHVRGVHGMWRVLIWRSGRSWAGCVWHHRWDEAEQMERDGIVSNASAANPITVAQLLISAMAVRGEQVAA